MVMTLQVQRTVDDEMGEVMRRALASGAGLAQHGAEREREIAALVPSLAKLSTLVGLSRPRWRRLSRRTARSEASSTVPAPPAA